MHYHCATLATGRKGIVTLRWQDLFNVRSLRSNTFVLQATDNLGFKLQRHLMHYMTRILSRQ